MISIFNRLCVCVYVCACTYGCVCESACVCEMKMSMFSAVFMLREQSVDCRCSWFLFPYSLNVPLYHLIITQKHRCDPTKLRQRDWCVLADWQVWTVSYSTMYRPWFIPLKSGTISSCILKTNTHQLLLGDPDVQNFMDTDHMDGLCKRVAEFCRTAHITCNLPN